MLPHFDCILLRSVFCFFFFHSFWALLLSRFYRISLCNLIYADISLSKNGEDIWAEFYQKFHACSQKYELYFRTALLWCKQVTQLLLTLTGWGSLLGDNSLTGGRSTSPGQQRPVVGDMCRKVLLCLGTEGRRQRAYCESTYKVF